MPSLHRPLKTLLLTLTALAGLSAADTIAPATPSEHSHLRQVPAYTKAGSVMKSVTCSEVHPAPPTGPEHTHTVTQDTPKQPRKTVTTACNLLHPAPAAGTSCPSPSPKGGCAHKPRC